MPKSTRQAKPRTAKSERVPEARSARAKKPAKPAAARQAASRKVEEEVEDEDAANDRGGPMCRSCGKRPGRPTAILGQMTQAELCAQCTALRKERIRLNRAAARGLRSTRLF
jgi:hypothetical protein